MCVASGKSFLERHPVSQGNVLVVSEEEKPRALQSRLHQLMKGLDITKEDIGDRLDLVVQRGVTLNESRWKTAIMKKCKEKGIKLVVFAPWSA